MNGFGKGLFVVLDPRPKSVGGFFGFFETKVLNEIDLHVIIIRVDE